MGKPDKYDYEDYDQQYENYNDKFEGYNDKYDHDNCAALAIMNGRIDLQKEPFIIGDN